MTSNYRFHFRSYSKFLNIRQPLLGSWGGTKYHISYLNVEERNKLAVSLCAWLWTIIMHSWLCFRLIWHRFHHIEGVSTAIGMVYLSDHVYNAEEGIMEEISAGGCSYIYLVGDFSFGRLPKEEQLVVIPFVMRTLRMAGLGECAFGPCHPEDEEVTEVRLQYGGFREGDLVESCLSCTTRYFPFTSIQASWSRIRSGVQSP